MSDAGCSACGLNPATITGCDDNQEYCIPCARNKGMHLLEQENSYILRRYAPVLDITPPPAPEGIQVDPNGEMWRLVCFCAAHPHRGHPAKPIK